MRVSIFFFLSFSSVSVGLILLLLEREREKDQFLFVQKWLDDLIHVRTYSAVAYELSSFKLFLPARILNPNSKTVIILFLSYDLILFYSH